MGGIATPDPGTGTLGGPETTPVVESTAAPEMDWGAFSQEEVAPAPVEPAPPAAPAPATDLATQPPPAAPAAAPPAAPTPAVPTATPVAPAVAPAAVGVPPAAPPVAPQAQPVQAPPQMPPRQASPQEMAQYRETVRGALEARYAQQMTPDIRDALMTEPDKAYPRLMSELHVSIYDSIFRSVTQQVPQIVQQQIAAHAVNSETEKGFFAEFPELNKPEYTQSLIQIGKMFRQMNPQATVEEASRFIGQMAMHQFGIVRNAPSPVQQPPAQAAPPAPRVAPHVPVGVGAAAPGRPVAQAQNPWAELAMFQE